MSADTAGPETLGSLSQEPDRQDPNSQQAKEIAGKSPLKIALGRLVRDKVAVICAVDPLRFIRTYDPPPKLIVGTVNAAPAPVDSKTPPLRVTAVAAYGAPDTFEVVTTPPVLPPVTIVGAKASGAPPIVNVVIVLFALQVLAG